VLLDAFTSQGFSSFRRGPDGRGGYEAVLGAAGRFWRLAGNDPMPGARTPDDLRDLDTPNTAKVAFDVRASPVRGGTLVTTETRVVATDVRSRRAFTAYWVVIRPFSGAIRRSWLRAVERRVVEARVTISEGISSATWTSHENSASRVDGRG
jgi:hypothetical protein